MGRRIALLVATSMYADPWFRALRAPANEVQELRQVLQEQGRFEVMDVLVNESKSQIERKIDDLFRECEPDDLALLYFSCHGIRTDEGRLLFAAVNTELARPDSTAVAASLSKTADLARRIAVAWPWPPAPKPSVLPQKVPYAEADGQSPNIVLGPVRRSERWAELDLARTGHVLCLGEPGSGKTALLRVVLYEIMRLHPFGDAVVVLVDPKRSMIGEAGAENLHYLAIPHEFEAVAEEVAAELRRRMRGRGTTAQGRFAGRRIFFLINDYEMAHGSRHLFDVLEPFVAQDIGFHLVVTRNSINSRHALEQDLLRGMLAAGCASLVLSGEERDGELLSGVRSVPRPPGRGVLLRPGEEEVVVQIAWAR
ncbi:S-DNA-T family DNA segregation ATPase FtsK/SpoIIIE [Saccharopolyspora erythraea NRRL 2338]|uniref:Cell division FtsK/SpoIIIE n=2 Tax=Saccharopolyspora erythraea TaxID=1836 RepID=A4FMS8_SACEN|nr:caspase family protein [Saccharopolyspora erythraea]PFG98998.1 S-DNA-T family DNA segregation ATPase FtsK/SpoIIIE [Saccharopolyspora erythraea NRRL 2338]QRK88969.1 caspase family protein [Saccharopolyspora erythraea]CAM05353.1 cell division FtsK/SpoIIIE [Saccharopolyspora erythraea NRRL 2338]